jgi:hypothetical protein
MTAKRSKRRTNALPKPEPLPELEPIVDAFRNALDLVVTAHAVIVEGDSYGSEESVLQQGCEALERVHDQLEEAELQLVRYRKSRNGKQVIS